MLNYENKIPSNQLEKEFEKITEKIGKIKLPKGFLEFLLYVISELFANIKEHSKTKESFFLIKLHKKECLIEIGDYGIGLRKSYLLKKIYPKDDFSAIEFALGGFSTKNPTERGFGLYTIRKFVEALGGKMIITTGRAFSVIEKNKIEFKKMAKFAKGTKIHLRIKIKKIDFYKYVE